MSDNKGCENCKFTNRAENEEPCIKCKSNYISQFEPMTNYDRFTEMGVEEMAHEMTVLFYKVKDYTNAEHYIKQWLLQEVDNEQKS